MIVIGLGSGRSGTASLAHLLNAQDGAHCFHELNPNPVSFSGSPAPILNTVSEFDAILKGGDPSYISYDGSRRVSVDSYAALQKKSAPISLIGDIALYYLNYVPEIASRFDNVIFLCLRRDRAATIASWEAKAHIPRWRSKWLGDRLTSLLTRQPFYTDYNFWMTHDGSIWKKNPVWDKCFPKYDDAPDRKTAIARYYDDYYERAEDLAKQYNDSFLLVETESMKTAAGQHRILDLCRIPRQNQNLVDAHQHRINS